MESTLLLNADGSPVTLIPISVLSWQDAISGAWAQTTEPLHYYEDWTVRSPSVTLRVPCVTILKRQVDVHKRGISTRGGPAARYVFLRDEYRCQYCGDQFARRDLTLDHVVPRVRGGKKVWENLTTACANCNCRRGHDERIQPMSRPFRPTYHYLVKQMRKFPITIPHPVWNFYLGWDESLVHMGAPDRRLGRVSSFALEDLLNASVAA